MHLMHEPESIRSLALILRGNSSAFLSFFTHLGLLGLFLVSIVDSSFVPLPIPGVTDIMVVLFAAGDRDHLASIVLLVLAATAGSATGGFLSHMVGHAGGMDFLKKHVPARILGPVTGWMQSHALVAVALPAILPPPMPLSPFVLAAGALDMDRKRFMTAFTLSRLARHTIAAWLGIHYGHGVLRLWRSISAKWGEPVLIGLWVFILLFVGIAFWRLYRTTRTVEFRGKKPA